MRKKYDRYKSNNFYDKRKSFDFRLFNYFNSAVDLNFNEQSFFLSVTLSEHQEERKSKNILHNYVIILDFFWTLDFLNDMAKTLKNVKKNHLVSHCEFLIKFILI